MEYRRKVSVKTHGNVAIMPPHAFFFCPVGVRAFRGLFIPVNFTAYPPDVKISPLWALIGGIS